MTNHRVFHTSQPSGLGEGYIFHFDNGVTLMDMQGNYRYFSGQYLKGKDDGLIPDEIFAQGLHCEIPDGKDVLFPISKEKGAYIIKVRVVQVSPEMEQGLGRIINESSEKGTPVPLSTKDRDWVTEFVRKFSFFSAGRIAQLKFK